MIVEACVESLEDAIYAEKRGANRIELCAQLQVGGTTPGPDLIKSVTSAIDIPVLVMIRPRGGNFVYSESELDQMRMDIQNSLEAGADGFVFGTLTDENEINLDQMRILMQDVNSLPVTFHKAIDEVNDPLKAVRELKKVEGVHRILSSGQQPTAVEGAATLNEMIAEAGEDLIIVAAGKITHENLDQLINLIHTSEFHGRKIVG